MDWSFRKSLLVGKGKFKKCKKGEKGKRGKSLDPAVRGGGRM